MQAEATRAGLILRSVQYVVDAVRIDRGSDIILEYEGGIATSAASADSSAGMSCGSLRAGFPAIYSRSIASSKSL